MSNSASISNRVIRKLEEIVKDKAELELIKDLMNKEQQYISEPSLRELKMDFDVRLEKRFPYNSESKDE